MKLSTKGRYAVMAMVDLASQPFGAASSLSSIAKRQRLSLSYLEQLFNRLKKAEIVDAERGAAGGYKLARPATQITLATILAASEEDVQLTRCGGTRQCMDGKPCSVHGLWEALGQHLDSFLLSHSLDDVVRNNLRTFAPI